MSNALATFTPSALNTLLAPFLNRWALHGNRLDIPHKGLLERFPAESDYRGLPELLAVCCDGRRSGVDGDLNLAGLARLIMTFGAEEAINLDGGGSATLVHRKHLLNRPYSHQDQPAPESRPLVTALLFERDSSFQ